MVEVTAPSTLPAGYRFTASYNGTVFPVTVPSSGVTEGQKLEVPFQGTGRWKDDIFACTRHGLCHPSLLNACCCSLILMGQIMTRLKLNYLASPTPGDEWRNTYKILVCIAIAYGVVQMLFVPADTVDLDLTNFDPTNPEFDPADTGDPTAIGSTSNPIGSMFNFVITIFMLVIVTKVRKLVRQQQSIPESNCVGCEDCCCAFWCGCCTVSQLARQTADYDNEEARFFSSTGVASAPKAQEIVV